MKILKTKTFFTYLVVGALVMALSVSCKSNEEAEGEVNIGQYAGTYASDNKAYGKDSGQYFVLRVNSDNIECSVSDNQTMSTIAVTFSKFTKTGEGIYASKSGSMLVDAVLNFSGNSLTYEASSGQRIMLDDTGNNFIFTVEQIEQPFTMTKVNYMGKNHSADIKNPNKGTAGTNITYDKNQGNRGKQMNVNYPNNANSSNKPKK